MKQKFTFTLLLLMIAACPVFAQVSLSTTNYNWSRIENSTPVLAPATNDADNGDGAGDGAMQIKGTANTPALQGVQYLLGGAPVLGEQINLEIKYYQIGSSYLRFKMQVFNRTDSLVLAETATFTTSTGVVGTGTLSYIFTAASAGDQILVRFVRADDLNPVRGAGIDYLKVNSQFVNMLPICKPTFSFDLPLTTATQSEIDELAQIRANLSDQFLGTTAPSTTEMDAAIAQYNLLNITVTGSTINGNPVTAPGQYAFLKTFAAYLKFNPTDADISTKAANAVWYLSKQNCNKVNAALTFYNYPSFSRPVVFLNSYLPDNVKALFGNTLYTETGEFSDMFAATDGAVNTDHIYLHLDVLFAYADWFNTNDEKIRYLKTVKRYLERFLIHTNGKADGIKKDGSAYHHNAAYDGYMYAFSTAARVMVALDGTAFQVDQASYGRFRDAIYAQVMWSNDAGIKPFAMAGRNPQTKTSTLASATLANLAIAGRNILGLASADTVLAGSYNRKYGVNSQFNYTSVTPFEQGYTQFNYGNMGVYRKNNWLAASKGQSDQLWGSEIYIKQNRFGRYQSYGTLEIIYQGNSETGNGHNLVGWDWNYNPGATTIVLPWDSLGAEKSRVDEYNTFGFAGALSLKQSAKEVLSNTMGESGLFAMRFKEKNNVGFGTTYGPNTHNATFEFTKTYFSIGDYIICLGAGIKNNDANHPTVTTLSQRLNNNTNDLYVNGLVKSGQSSESFSGSSPNWVLDNYNTGYYIVPGSGTLKIRNSLQQTPYQNQEFPSDSLIGTNGSNNYRLAYLDHGNAPADNSYEFVCLPATDGTQMAAFSQLMSGDEKPYTVHQNSVAAQIIEHKALKTWAYALPLANSSISAGIVRANDTPCLVMYKSLSQNYNQILLSISNPDMGASPSAPKTVRLTLNYEWTLSQNANATVVSSDTGSTVIDFVLADGMPVEVTLSAVCPPAQVTIADVYAMNPAVDAKNTIYIGYGPASLSINASATGSQDFAYSWNTGEQTPSLSVSQAGIYTATVTYAGVCQSSASIAIETLDVRCGNNNDKIMICHNNKVICVASDAIQAHLAHGDKLGSCTAGARTGVRTNDLDEAEGTFNVTAYPNPVSEKLHIAVPNPDANGKVVISKANGEVIRSVRLNSAKQELSLKGLLPGVYFINIQNGNQTVVKKIVKY